MQENLTIIVVQSKNDKKSCFSIRRKVFVEEQKVPIEHELDGLDEEALHFLVYLNNEPVATGRIRIVDGFAKLERIAVVKEHRKIGIGKKLVEAMLKEVNTHLEEFLPLISAQLRAEPFYEKMGWVRFGDAFKEAGIEHVYMVYLPKTREKLEKLRFFKDANVSVELKKILFSAIDG